jgi:hypothetical protein
VADTKDYVRSVKLPTINKHKHQTPNTKQQIPNTKQQIPNTKHQTTNRDMEHSTLNNSGNESNDKDVA